MGKMRRRLLTVGVAGASVGGILFTPFGNNLAKDVFHESGEAIIPERVYPQEMTDAANGGTFDTTRFISEDRTYTDRQKAVGDMVWYSGTLNNRRVSAAAACGLLAANEFTIPQGALDQWKTAEAAPSGTEVEKSNKNAAYDAVGKLCVDAFPLINAEGTPEEVLQSRKVTIFVDVVG